MLKHYEIHIVHLKKQCLNFEELFVLITNLQLLHDYVKYIVHIKSENNCSLKSIKLMSFLY